MIDPNYVDWLRNLQIRFALEKNLDVLDISDLGSISNNEKVKDVYLDIIYGKFGYWENNYKNYLTRLKQDASIAPKGVSMIQIYFSLSGFDSDTWVLDTVNESYIYNLLQRLQNIKGLKIGDLELYGASGESISAEAVEIYMLNLP